MAATIQIPNINPIKIICFDWHISRQTKAKKNIISSLEHRHRLKKNFISIVFHLIIINHQSEPCFSFK